MNGTSRRRALLVVNRLTIALIVLWAKATGQRWFIEYDGTIWRVVDD